MNLLIIYNPQAGNGRAKTLLAEISDYLTSLKVCFTVKQTKHQSHAVELVKKANLSKFDAVIASGGDGTLFEVLNGYFKNQLTDKPPLGLIPNGTGNAFMKELNLNKGDWKKAIDNILSGKTSKIDVGKLVTKDETYYFLNIVGLGFVAEVAKASIPLKWAGNSAYTLATLFKLLSVNSEMMRIEIDGVMQQRDVVMVEVANSRYTGTKFKIAPKAKLNDGLLDLIILNKITRLKLLKVFHIIYDGSHINYPEIEYIQAKQIKVTQKEPGQLIPDGEILGFSPVEFNCLAGELEFLIDCN